MNFIFWLETFICGIGVGCFAMFGIVHLCIKLDEKRERHEAVKAYARRNGVSFETADHFVASSK